MKIIITFIFTFVLFINIKAQNQANWEILNEGIEAHTIDFIDDNYGWLLTSDKLWRTEDGGESWETHTPPSELQFSTIIKFTSSTIGWATGGEDYPYRNLHKTEDSGLTWVKSFGSTNSSIDFAAVDDSVVFVIEYFINGANNCDGKIFKTTESGKNWIDITPSNIVIDFSLQSISFFDRDKGLVIGGCSNYNRKVLKTFDGGLNWEMQTLPSPFSFINRVQIVQDSTLYFIAEKATDPPVYYFGLTTDMFESWTLTYESENPIYNFYALDRENIFASIEESFENLYLKKSTDGGYTWQKKQQIWSQDQIYFNTPQSGFITGDGYYRTTDGGESWIIKNFGGSCQDVFFIDDKIGFIVRQDSYPFPGIESGGSIYQTTDGGITWSSSSDNPATSILFVSDIIGYTLNYYGQIMKTINQGQEWTEVYTDYSELNGYNMDPSDIGFMNKDTGWAVGSGILGTTDGGNNWDLKWTDPSSDYGLESIHIINNTAWIVGGNGLILKSLNADSFVVINTDTDLPLNDVFFSDKNHGWIAGGYIYWWEKNFQSILLRTNDAGKTWTKKSFDKYLINDMYFADSLHGWAVGNDTVTSDNWPWAQGMVLETWDGGEHWNPIVENLSVRLNAIHFKDGYGWAVGDNGLVLRTEDGSTWINQNTGGKNPSKFHLSQNYPNPFNPSTKIKFTVPITVRVRIELYSTLGQRVRTILDKNKSAGQYEVEFDGSNLASGIYYYQLVAGEYREVKKMILIK